MLHDGRHYRLRQAENLEYFDMEGLYVGAHVKVKKSGRVSSRRCAVSTGSDVGERQEGGDGRLRVADARPRHRHGVVPLGA